VGGRERNFRVKKGVATRSHEKNGENFLHFFFEIKRGENFQFFLNRGSCRLGLEKREEKDFFIIFFLGFSRIMVILIITMIITILKIIEIL